jgi:hypothetical protein
MSEPTIKPRLWCKECGEVDANHTGEFVQSFKHLHAVYEGFTHDDLVAVALVLLVPFAPADGLRAAAEAVVERLTGVKR